MRLHYCGHQGCRERLPISIRYCEKHKADNKPSDKFIQQQANRKYNQLVRDKEANSFYQSKQWQSMRDYVYARDMGVCQICGEAITDRKIVDHIHPLKFSNSEKLDSNNLWTLCNRCHNIKTSLEVQIAESPNGANKLKHIKPEWYKDKVMNLRNKDAK